MATPFFPMSTPLLLPLLCFSIFYFFHTSLSQAPNPVCNGVLITYNYVNATAIPPLLLPDDPANQAYRFESRLTVRNNGRFELKNWRVFVGFRHGELLVSSANAALADSAVLPANVSGGAVFVGSPVTDLETAIETAGNVDRMQAVVDLVGTQFGVRASPENVTLANDGYLCNDPTTQGNNTVICCMPDSNRQTTINPETEFSPLQTGDLTIAYDVLMTQESNYYAQVNLTNHNPLARLENWQLSFDWTQGEFINSMRGAYPQVLDTGDCIFGNQGQFYQGFDFSKALTCKKRPTIIDLPVTRTNDTNLGMVPFCCKNGTILPPSMDPTKSISVFQMQVYKMPPYLNKTELNPPLNWQINSTVGPGYQCGQPIRVNPSRFPDPSGLPSETEAVATWQVACNLTRAAQKPVACCVSLSSFFNDSIVPCNTCACGCNERNPRSVNSDVCSATGPSLLLPSEALLIPFENRTKMAREFADLKRRDIPNPLPCGDNCGISINWHLLSDFRDGWTARITLFNWGETDVVDWFTAVQLDKAMPGFEAVYSMDGKVLTGSNNSTLFLQGLPGLNYLVAEQNGSNPRKDPRVPGTQQTVISFKKKQTPGINVGRGDGFPTKIYFNGEECSIPEIIPSKGSRTSVTAFSCIVGLLMMILILM